MRSVMNSAIAALTVMAIAAGAGCSVRRPYEPPVPNAPAAWSAPVTQPAADVESLSRWWDTFGDDQLTALVRRAVTGNLDVRTAISRIREARATMRSTRTQLLPSADATGSVRGTGTGSDAGIGGVTQSYSLAVDASWEIDVFGGIRSTVDAAARHCRRTRGRPAGRPHQPDSGRGAELHRHSFAAAPCRACTVECRPAAGDAGAHAVPRAGRSGDGPGRSTSALERRDDACPDRVARKCGRTINSRNCHSSRPAAGRAECGIQRAGSHP